MTPVINGHQFYLETIRLQDAAVKSAVEKVNDCKDNTLRLTTAKAGRFSRKICRDVYATFEEKLSSEFSSEEYKDLVSLTLNSRTTFFFLDLKEQLKNLLLEDGADALKKCESKALNVVNIEEKGCD